MKNNVLQLTVLIRETFNVRIMLNMLKINIENIRDETIWRYIDTVSIRRVTIRIVAQCDISRYDLDTYKEGKSLRCLYFLVFVQEI